MYSPSLESRFIAISSSSFEFGLGESAMWPPSAADEPDVGSNLAKLDTETFPRIHYNELSRLVALKSGWNPIFLTNS